MMIPLYRRREDGVSHKNVVHLFVNVVHLSQPPLGFPYGKEKECRFGEGVCIFINNGKLLLFLSRACRKT